MEREVSSSELVWEVLFSTLGSGRQLLAARQGRHHPVKANLCQLRGVNGVGWTMTQQNAAAKVDSVTTICCVMAGGKKKKKKDRFLITMTSIHLQ